MPLTISRLTREYIFTDIETPDDLTGATGEVAFKSLGELPEALDWESCDLIDTAGEWSARVLVGVDTSITLEPPDVNEFDWQMWLRIDDNPERPVRKPGIVTVE